LGTLLTSPSDSPSPQLGEFKMSEREVPMTTAQLFVIKFLTNENFGPNEIWRILLTIRGINTIEDASEILA